MFSFFKKLFETSQKPTPESNNTVILSTQQKLDCNNVIKEEMSANPKFHRTPHEEDLSFNFYTSETHSAKISEFENKLYDAVAKIHYFTPRSLKKANESEIKKAIDDCNHAIKIFNRFKNYCYRTKGGTIYFQDTWEYFHNSKNTCFSYIERAVKLKELLEEFINNKK